MLLSFKPCIVVNGFKAYACQPSCLSTSELHCYLGSWIVFVWRAAPSCSSVLSYMCCGHGAGEETKVDRGLASTLRLLQDTGTLNSHRTVSGRTNDKKKGRLERAWDESGIPTDVHWKFNFKLVRVGISGWRSMQQAEERTKPGHML